MFVSYGLSCVKLITRVLKKAKLDSCGNADDINKYFSYVVRDNEYSTEAVLEELHRQTNVYDATDVNVTVTADYSDFDIMVMLSRITNTASGSDDLPFWLYRECANELSHVLSMLINFSINKGEVPRAWKQAVITPIPKTAPAVSVSDLRPISVTPVLKKTLPFNSV